VHVIRLEWKAFTRLQPIYNLRFRALRCSGRTFQAVQCTTTFDAFTPCKAIMIIANTWTIFLHAVCGQRVAPAKMVYVCRAPARPLERSSHRTRSTSVHLIITLPASMHLVFVKPPVEVVSLSFAVDRQCIS
jgi:hypothetical protein